MSAAAAQARRRVMQVGTAQRAAAPILRAST